MEILKTRSDAWGQQVLEGANLELVVVFALAGAVMIVLHAVISAWLGRRRSSDPTDE